MFGPDTKSSSMGDWGSGWKVLGVFIHPTMWGPKTAKFG